MEAKEKAIDNRKIRFSDAPWANSPQHIIVGGVGGIGSWTSLYLSRIGHILYLYDIDIIDETNMGGQFYKIDQIKSKKTEATRANILNFCGADAKVFLYDKYEEDSAVTPIMISCFDNMAARKAMFENWAKYEKREVFIDGRLLAEIGMVFTVQKGQEEEYRKHLFADEEVEEVACSFKATSHAGGLIGAIITGCLNNFLSNKAQGNNDRVIPFKTDFVLPIMHFFSEEIVISAEKPKVVEKVKTKKVKDGISISKR